MRTWRKHWVVRSTTWVLLVCLVCWQIQIPVWGRVPSPTKPSSELKAGLTDRLTPAQQKKLERRRATVPDVRALSPSEMAAITGRGPHRNPYLAGAPLPWQKSLRDVNLCTGNLFKSYTDIQVQPARGAGLVLQRTYSSNDARVGPFGVGWTHAYDIRMQESADVQTEAGNISLIADPNAVPRTDFFGGKHSYHRDADGLYSPPPYLHDDMRSNYNDTMEKGLQVLDDTDTGKDGTIKHYTNVLFKADGTPGNERACDYIQDRYGNRTNLEYNDTETLADGSTRKLLSKVTDPSGRTLEFTWENLSEDENAPAWRITQVVGPQYTVTYEYYTDTGDANAADDLYNLKAVHLDPDGLDRVTTYAYTSATGPNGTENALLASVSDPLGHTVSYQYAYDLNFISYWDWGGPYSVTDTIWVTGIQEPGSGGAHDWNLYAWTERGTPRPPPHSG